MVGSVELAGRRIGPGQPCFVIAEAGVNHDGRVEQAVRLIDAAHESGVDAVKFQTWVTERLMTRQARMAAYQTCNTGRQESQFEMAKRLELSREAFRRLKSHADATGLCLFSTPDEEESADFLDTLEVPAFKIGSGDVTNLPFLRHVAGKGRPVILSTGMSTLTEVNDAVRAIEAAGNRQIALLHCVSSYPAEAAECNLRAMQTLRAAFGYPVGFSDHTLGSEVALAAVALGACVIEKHVTLDRGLPGPDHRASLDPEALRALVQGIRAVERSLGHGRKEPAPSEADAAMVVRKSLVAAREIPAGTTLTEELIAVKRPGTGLPPTMRARLVGRLTRVAIAEDTLLSEEMLA